MKPNNNVEAAKILEVKNFKIARNKKTILEFTEFNAKAGDFIGLVGVNGAGKTSFLLSLAGVLQYKGEVKICGANLGNSPNNALKNIGFLADSAPLNAKLKVAEFLEFIGNIQEVANLNQTIKNIAEKLNFIQYLQSEIGILSKGFRKRVALAGALLGEAKLILLDEMSDGLDPEEQKSAFALLQEISPRCAIILSSHRMEEISQYCTKVIQIENGALNEKHLKQKSAPKPKGSKK